MNKTEFCVIVVGRILNDPPDFPSPGVQDPRHPGNSKYDGFYYHT